MTLQNKITQIILDIAPSNTTIAQIKLMAAKLVAVVDEAISSKDGAPLPDNGNLKPEQFIKVSVVPCNDWITLDKDDDEEFTLVEQPKTEERMKLDVNDDGTFSWSKVQVPVGEDKDDGNQGLCGLSRDEVSACASAPYEWVCALEQGDNFAPSDRDCECWRKKAMRDVPTKRRYRKTQKNLLREELSDDDSTPSDKPPLDPQSEESLKAMAKLGIDINATQQRPMTICYGNGMDDMFIRYHDERNHWALYNWRMVDVDERDKWLEEARIKLFINVVVSDDLQWIWRNGEWAKAEKWEVS